MILDERAEFADAVALSTDAPDTDNIGDVIDIRAVAGGASPPLGDNVLQNIGVTPIYLVITVATGITVAAATGTLQFQLVSDAVEPPDVVSATVHLLTPSVVTTTTPIAVGTVLFAGAIPTDTAYEQYVGVQEIVVTTALNAGAINAFLTLDPAVWSAYADSPDIVT